MSVATSTASNASKSATPTNSLISPNPSTSGLTISLHPLALLSISDYITRHTLKYYLDPNPNPNEIPPIVGALLGTQEGRNIHVEHAYEVLVLPRPPLEECNDDEPEIMLDEEWFDRKLKLFKETHTACDLLGWFSTTKTIVGPPYPPTMRCRDVHRKLLKYNESLFLLMVNPGGSASGARGKLPVGIWESVIEDDGGQLRFVELGYTIETGEAEMIGVDFVAKGGWGNAAEVFDEGISGTETKKERAVMRSVRTSQNDELLSNLTAKRNAIAMLHSRILLLKSYLEQLSPPNGIDRDPSPSAPLSHPLLRSLKSLTHSRLPLLTPDPNTPDYKLYQQESLAEQSDVSLVALLGTLTRSVEEMKEVQRKFGIVEQGQNSAKKAGGGIPVFEMGDGVGMGIGMGSGNSGQGEKDAGKEKSGGGALGSLFNKFMRGVAGAGGAGAAGNEGGGSSGAGASQRRGRLGE